jgi:hypothetical protein
MFGALGSVALILLFPGSIARAEVLESTPTLPPPSGIYGVHATLCLLAGCIVENDIGNLVVTSSQIVAGNQFVMATSTTDADVFQNNGGVPGGPIGSLMLVGTVSITYVGRSSDTQLGSFPSILTSFDFMGSFNSHTILTRLTPGQISTGVTTISKVAGAQAFLVDSFFDVFAGVSVDGGPFIPQPKRNAVLESPVPEPANIGLALPCVIGFAALAWQRRRRLI